MFPLITADLNTAQQVMDPRCTGLTMLFLFFSCFISLRQASLLNSTLVLRRHHVDYMQADTLWMFLKCKVAKKKKNLLELQVSTGTKEWMNESKGSDCNWAYFWVLWPHSHLLQKSVILNLFIFYLLWDKDGLSSVNVAKMKTTMHWCQ